jgi:hypothetical protein
MSHSTISEPTTAEHLRAADFTPPTLEQFAAQLEADAPPPREDAPAPHEEAPAWRLPRTGSGVAHGLHPHAATVSVEPRENFVKLSLLLETSKPSTRLISARREILAEGDYAEAHARLLDSPEHAKAVIVLPQHARAGRNLKAAKARLVAVQEKRAKLERQPPKAGLGAALVELDKEAAAASAEAEGHAAEVKALDSSAEAARAELVKAAAAHCRQVKDASYDARLERLRGLLAAFYAAHGEELTEIAVVAATRSVDEKVDAAALARTVRPGRGSRRRVKGPLTRGEHFFDATEAVGRGLGGHACHPPQRLSVSPTLRDQHVVSLQLDAAAFGPLEPESRPRRIPEVAIASDYHLSGRLVESGHLLLAPHG